jgi:hypothetical protein
MILYYVYIITFFDNYAINVYVFFCVYVIIFFKNKASDVRNEKTDFKRIKELISQLF